MKNSGITAHKRSELLPYLNTGALSALFENWESEFLQMSAYVMLTAMLFQRGWPSPAIPMTPTGPTTSSGRLRAD